MFVYSFKASKRQIVSMVLCVLMLVAVLVVAVMWPWGKTSAETFQPVAAASDNERLSFLTELGYEVDAATATVKEMLIPDQFDDVFVKYNQIQQEAGMDLESYGGKRVKCWTYRVLNVPAEGEVLAHLYVYKDKIIGGDIASTALNGFMHGLTKYNAADYVTTTSAKGSSTQATTTTKTTKK